MGEKEIEVQVNAAELRRLRNGKGWSQEWLAHKAKTSQSTVAKLEAGIRKTARLSTVKGLADALGVPTDDLLTSVIRVVEQSEERLKEIRETKERYGLVTDSAAEEALKSIERLRQREKRHQSG